MEKKPAERLYTVGEAARALGMSPAKVYALVIRGEIKSALIGGNRCITEEWLEEYVQEAIRKALPQRADIGVLAWVQEYLPDGQPGRG